MKESVTQPNASDPASAVPDLELPILPDVLPHRSEMTLDQYAEWNESLRQWLADRMPTREERLARKVDAEFRI